MTDDHQAIEHADHPDLGLGFGVARGFNDAFSPAGRLMFSRG